MLKRGETTIGGIYLYKHPKDARGGQLHLYIKPDYRKKWLTKQLAAEMVSKFIETAKSYQIHIIYSIALTEVSPRMLEFFGFQEYYKKQPKTYYYLKI